MATLFDQEARIVPTWIHACRSLLARSGDGREARNFVLEVSDPMTVSEEDRLMLHTVDSLLRRNADSSIETIAGTIFPQAIYAKYGRPAFYEQFLESMKKGRKPNTWGTYALRMIIRDSNGVPINPLETLVEKLKYSASEGHGYRSAYEIGFVEPGDLAPGSDIGFELPTYDPVRDRNMVSNMPCLSHLSFNLDERAVDLTAMYRSHYYCSKALGNLIGLARLQAFVAKETGLNVGTLTCLSTHARLDPGTLGGLRETRRLLGVN